MQFIFPPFLINSKKLLFAECHILKIFKVPITPDSAYNEVDDSPFTWAILVYNSNNNEFFDG